MVYRIFVEKKKEFAGEAKALLNDARTFLGIEELTDVRLFNRYDAEKIDAEVFQRAVGNVFSEPQLDLVSRDPDLSGAIVFAVEYLPGQFDQRADSAAQCIQILASKANMTVDGKADPNGLSCERPIVRSAKVYALYGMLSNKQIEAIKHYVINPVEAQEASLELPDTLEIAYVEPKDVAVLEGFLNKSRDELSKMIKSMGLAMDIDDIEFCREYFRSEHRDPTITEIRMIDTYWSDHCRHTTFGTIIDRVHFCDPKIEAALNRYHAMNKELGRNKPMCLMDVATLAAKYLKENGMLDKLDESEEINACTVKIEVTVDGRTEPWLLLFKNETHNHPTEIEPFGGAATCIGGAIRDPLSGRSYVYGAMRVTGAADPTVSVNETIPGKLPQRKLVTTAAAGYSSYGNQIGLATGIVDEIYHPGYAAKRMEIGAVIASTPAENVRRETPAPGDVVILLGGSTGRDGIGGATGSSKAHDSHSVETCGAEVQKGNAPEERKLQRLFRNGDACRMIKRCNDFGAGGVSVAIGELADGLRINLDAVPKKYEGLDGTELAISESQERMAVVVEAADEEKFLAIAASENLQAVRVATVQADPRLVMSWRGKTIVDVSRKFLNSNGAEKHIAIDVALSDAVQPEYEGTTFTEKHMNMVSSLNCCSRRGLAERFDSTIGAGTVLMPFGGKYQLTPIQAMVQKISVENKHTDDCSLMSWGYNPFIMEKNCYDGAYLAVVESVCKLIATGATFKDVYLTFQEYFEKPDHDCSELGSKRWGKPLAALLGAFDAQLDLGIAAIGGKDSMSGSFEKLDVPPTLVSFAVTTAKTKDIVSPEFKASGHNVLLVAPKINEKTGLPDSRALKAEFEFVHGLLSSGKALACYTPGIGGIAEAVFKMCIGNGVGFTYYDTIGLSRMFNYSYGSFILELADDCELVTESANRISRVAKSSVTEELCAELIGETTSVSAIAYENEQSETCSIGTLLKAYEGKLENVYPCNISSNSEKPETFSYELGTEHTVCGPAFKTAKPRILIPVFPGTNCEYDSAKAVSDAGAIPEFVIVRNLTGDAILRSIEEFSAKLMDSQAIFIPGGFSGGDEPDGSGKFITAFFRNEEIREGVADLLGRRDGLMCGICNGFQALIKLGLVPYGKIIDTDEYCATLTFNTIGRHQSKLVRTRVASNKSPWLSNVNVGDVFMVPISHGEGRFVASEELIRRLAANGQIATQYVDFEGLATSDIAFNPNNSMYAIEGITSPDGRVFGKMGHSERIGAGLYKNVPGEYDIKMFRSAVDYFTK